MRVIREIGVPTRMGTGVGIGGSSGVAMLINAAHLIVRQLVNNCCPEGKGARRPTLQTPPLLKGARVRKSD